MAGRGRCSTPQTSLPAFAAVGGGVVSITGTAPQPTLNVVSAALTSTTISSGTLTVDNILTSPVASLMGRRTRS